MKKRTLLISFIALGASQTFAQTNNVTTVYMANTGEVVATKEKADFVRQVLPPDPGVDKKTSTILDFYMNGNKKLVAHTREVGTSESLYGSYIDYFKNGSRKSIRNYKNGELVGDAVYYYPNGQTYYTTNNNRIVQSLDLAGNVIAENGNGKWIIYNDAFKVVAQGPIVNGKQEGEWTGFDNSGAKTTGIYKNGKLVSGNLFADDTQVYENNKDLDVSPSFPGGNERLARFLSSELKYPKLASKNKTEGEVLVNFIVEKDGKLSNVKVANGIGSGCDEEAVRIIEKSQPWTPGMLYGAPRRVAYSVNVVISPNPRYIGVSGQNHISNMQSIQRPVVMQVNGMNH
jgi:TonB family protein